MKNKRQQFVIYVTAIYLIFGLGWITLTDRLLAAFIDIQTLVELSRAKGIFFILITTAYFYLSLKSMPRENQERELFDDAHSTAFYWRITAPWARYSVALILTSITFWLWQDLAEHFDQSPLYILFMLPIIISSMLGGFGPGCISTLLSIALLSYLEISNFELTAKSPITNLHLGLILVCGVSVSYLSARLHKSLRQAIINQNLLQAIIEGTTDAVFIKDVNGRYQLVNSATCRYIGKSAPEILGHSDDELLPHISSEQFINNDLIIFRTKQTNTFEEHLATQNGQKSSFLATKGPILDRNGDALGMFGISRDVTEFKRLHDTVEQQKAALETSEVRFRQLYEQAPIALSTCDLDGRLLSINQEFGKLFGYTTLELHSIQDWLEKSAILANDQDPRQQWLHLGQDAGDNSPYSQSELNLQCKSGAIKTVFVKHVRLGNEIILALVDISERKAIERALVESQQRLQILIDHAPAALAMFDRDMKYLALSQRWRDDFKMGPLKNVLGHSHYAIFPEIGQQWKSIHQRALAGEIIRNDKDSFKRKDGSEQWLKWEIRPWHAADGMIGGIVIFSEEITQRILAETELEQYRMNLEKLVESRTNEVKLAEQRYRQVVESSAEGILELNARGHICMVNPSALDLLGFSTEQLLNQNIHEAIHYQKVDGSPYAATECALCKAVIGGEKLYRDNEIFWHADGHAIPVTVITHPIWIKDQLSGAVFSFFDNTERHVAEMAREEARQSAEQLAKIKSEFLANMSHEIRTPLNGVLGLAQIGYRDSQNQDIQQIFARILDSGKLLLTIINDILDFSKIEAGKLDIESVPLNPCSLIEEVYQNINTLALTKNLKLICNKGNLPKFCLGDPVRIAQVLMNLLSNACKFTQTGEIRLSAWRENQQLVFQVSDSGIGISPETLSKLFAPFEQADTSRTRKYGGTGLGLTICRRLTELMGGTLQVSSTLGQGSTFTLNLPLRETDLSTESKAFQADSAKQRLQGLRLLIAEDNMVNQLILEDILQHEGAEVVIAPNGRLVTEAVKNASQPFNAVLMDVQMPEMDGLEATRKIKLLNPNLPIIGQTAHAFKEEHDRCLQAGMVTTLTKPIDIEKLIEVLLDYQVTPPSHSSLHVEPKIDHSETGIIDWQALSQRFQYKTAFIDNLIKKCIDIHGKDSERLMTLIESSNLPEIALLAHDLKSMAGNFCATELESLTLRVMDSARKENGDTLTLALELVDKLNLFIATLKQGQPN